MPKFEHITLIIESLPGARAQVQVNIPTPMPGMRLETPAHALAIDALGWLGKQPAVAGFVYGGLPHMPPQCLHQIAEPATQEPFMWAIKGPDGSAYMDEGCVSSVREDVQAEVDGLNSGLDDDDDPYKVVPVYLAAAPQAVQAAVPEGWKLAPIKVPDSAFAWVSGGYPAGFKAGDKRDTAVVHERAQRTWEAILNGITAPAHPAESVPAQIETLRSELAEEKEAADNWRRLALQFDIHRLQALWHLKRILHADSSVDEYKAAEQFLAAPPLDGEAVLAQRIAALAATQPAPAIFGDEDHVLVPRGLIGAACYAIDKKRDGTKTLAELRRYTTGDLSAATQPAAQGAATTGYIAPKGRYVPPVLFSPYTGEPRDARDIASDPRGILIVPPGAALAAQAKQGDAA